MTIKIIALTKISDLSKETIYNNNYQSACIYRIKNEN